MRAAALQFDVLRDRSEANLETVCAAIGRAPDEGIELVVLPEMWVSSFSASHDAQLLKANREAVSALAAAAQQAGVMVAGSALGGDAQSGRFTNRLELFDGAERLLCYDKVHLFSPTAENVAFAAGEQPPVTVDTRLGRLSGLVCYDIRFPEWTREPFRDRAELLVVCAQWPRPRETHWRALVCGLAVANQCFVVACNRTGRDRVGRRQLELEFPGNSLIVHPSGEVLAEGRGEAGWVQAALALEDARELRRRVPVARDQRPALYRLPPK